MQEKLPKIIHLDGKGATQIINRHRLRKLIHKKYDYAANSLPLPDLALHHLIAMSAQNLTVLPKKKALCESLRRDSLPPHPQPTCKKVLIFQQRTINKENDISDLKTCKSLLNPKVAAPKKLLHFFAKKRSHDRYVNQSIQSLWDITDRNQIDRLKLPKNQDFELVPWGMEESDKQNVGYCI